MTPGRVIVEQQYKKNVAVLVQAGLEPPGMNNPVEVTNQKISRAIEKSIISSKLFAKIVQRQQADYLLNVSMISLDYDGKPFREMTASIEMAWSLIDLNHRVIVLRKSIHSSHRIEFNWHQSVGARRRKAMEGAIQANVLRGLNMLGEQQEKNEK